MSETSTQQPSTTETAAQSSETRRGQLDVLDQLLKPEVQESLSTLVDNLPKLAEMVTFLTDSFDFVKSVSTDKVLANDIVGGIKEFSEPITGKVKELASAAVEASDRAEADQSSTIGLFGLLKMLKDPQVQKLFRFAQAYLDIMAERQKQK
ncbi:DUF1641 domain-containing protein [Fictibacillus sp. Mic-4]|uniref:DUF1641 domain-containing protein n=1 Tax=Fictibacillus TaxID=1329200 RepID=UPI0003FE1B86|nr:DUF1641 domain-containing protein [Fictibacillus gelatini]